MQIEITEVTSDSVPLTVDMLYDVIDGGHQFNQFGWWYEITDDDGQMMRLSEGREDLKRCKFKVWDEDDE